MIQFFILTLGTLTIFLLAQKNKFMRYGYIIGAIQEIFWFITTYQNKQWGIFVLCFIYSGCYLLGIYNYFIRKK